MGSHDHNDPWPPMIINAIQICSITVRFIWAHWHIYDQLLPGAFTWSYGRFQGVAGVGCRFRNQIHMHNNTDRCVSHVRNIIQISISAVTWDANWSLFYYCTWLDVLNEFSSVQQLQHTHFSLNLLKTQQVLNDRFQMFFFGGKTGKPFSPYSFPRVHHRGYGLVELLAGMLAATAFKARVLEMVRGQKIDAARNAMGNVPW